MKQFSSHLHTENSNFKKQFLRIGLLLFETLQKGIHANAPCGASGVENHVVYDNITTTAINFSPHLKPARMRKLLLLATTTIFLFSFLTTNGQATVATNPAVTINQSAAQTDPTNQAPINFTAVFDQPVTGFATGDVTVSGTAGALVATVTGGPTLFNVAVSGMTNCGTVIVNIPAGVCTNALAEPNLASTSTDNTVTLTSFPLTVNPVPNQQLCTGAATSAVNFTSTPAGATFTWTNSTPSIGLPASGTGNIASFTAVNLSATAVIATITVTPSIGACTGTPLSFTITVNPLPVVLATRGTTCGGPCNSMSVSGTADLYVWSPLAGLYTDCPPTQPYTGNNVTTVYTAPGNSNLYIVTGTNSATGCLRSAMAIPNYTPPAPIVIPSPVNMCVGDPAVKLKVVTAFTNQFCSGPVNIAVPDNNPAGASNNFIVSGLPLNCSITEISVAINMQHTRIGNMVFVLKAPNGQIINLDYFMTSSGGTGATTGFVNSIISSVGITPLSGGVNPYTGTFRADLVNGGGPLGPSGPTGFLPTAASWAGLIPTTTSAIGSWTLAFYDGVTGDIGTLSSWCLNFTYSCGNNTPTTPATWSPITGLFTDPSALPAFAYTGDARDSVWVRPTPSGIYPYQVTTQSLPMPPVAFTNATPITINSGGAATSYPANLNVSGLPAGITIRSIVLNNISHTRSEDIDIVLQSPSGQNVILMSDVGGANPVNGTYTFVQLGQAMSAIAANPTGNYEATNNVVPDNFPAPGPGNVTQALPSISMFTGNFNGTWKLFVMDDDATAGQGIISGGYTINFDLGGPSCTSPATTVVVRVVSSVTIITHPANQTLCPTNAVATFMVSVAGSGPNSYQWQVSTDGGTIWNNISAIAPYSGSNTGALTINPVTAGMNGYLYRVIINGGTNCSVTSNAGLLTINPLPTAVITANPLVIGPSQTTTIFSTVTANPAATNAWYLNGTVLPGEVAATLLVNYGSPGDYQLKVTNVCGVGLSNIITIANSFALNMYVYPNPSGGIFQVRYASEAGNSLQRSLTVYNNWGEKIITKTFTQTIPYQKIDVDVRAHGKGIFWVELRDAKGKRLATRRVVVQ